MAKLSEKDCKRIIELLKNGEEIPIDYKHVLFPPDKKEYELTYAGKEREEDILADTMAVPLQPIKTFSKNGSGWTNKLIFGDNLQVLKSLLDDNEVKGQIKLIYIDPPFATKQEFRGSQDQKAYQDKIYGAKFIEFLRKRLILLRQLLAEDGSIYVHLDWKKVHYVKIIMDEIFGEENFQREVIWRIGWVSGYKSVAKNWIRNHETLLFYSKNKDNFIFNKEKAYVPYPADYERWGGREKGNGYAMEDMWGVFEKEGVTSLQVVSFSGENTAYPTQKPEGVLKRIIDICTNENDLVVDAFAGSGTTLAVAEKLRRRWIGIDCGKLAIYTIQKRLLNLKSEIGNKGKSLKSKPFTLYHAGLYDFSKLKQLPWVEWRRFALLLFNCRDEKHSISGIELDGYKGRSAVLVFDYQKEGGVILDYGFMDDLHSMIGSKISKQFFIIAPAASVTFLEDYIEKGSVRYYILRIPYSIINELHIRDFEAIKQPIDETQVNDTVDAVGFDFIRQPKVECSYSFEKLKDKSKETTTIKINTFKSEAMLKGASQLQNRESLSMIMVDFSYDGDIFNLDKVYYASEIEKNSWKVNLHVEEFKEQIMIIYLDIYGNEYREIKTLKDFLGVKQDRKGSK